MKFIAFVATIVFSSSAVAGGYVGISLGASKTDNTVWQGRVDSPFDQAAISNGESSSRHYSGTEGKAAFVGRVFAGIDRGETSFEVGFVSSGESKSSTVRDGGEGHASMGVRGVDASVLYRPVSGNFFLRAGVHRSTLTVRADSWIHSDDYHSRLSATTTGPLVGIGLRVRSFRVELMQYRGLGLTDITGRHNISALMVGVEF